MAINLLWAGPGIAQVPAGQIDLVALGFAPVAEPAVDLDIGAAEFDMAALATQATDPDLALLLGAVEGFHLKQFAPPDQATVLAASNLATALILPAWLAIGNGGVSGYPAGRGLRAACGPRLRRACDHCR